LRHRVRPVPRGSHGDKKSRPAYTIPSPLIQEPSRRKQADADPEPRPPGPRDAAAAARKAVFARNLCGPFRASASRIELVATHDIAIRACIAPIPRRIPRPPRFACPSPPSPPDQPPQSFLQPMCGSTRTTSLRKPWYEMRQVWMFLASSSLGGSNPSSIIYDRTRDVHTR